MRASVYFPSIGITFPLASSAKSKSNTDKSETMVAQTVASAACRPTQTLQGFYILEEEKSWPADLPSSKTKCQDGVVVIQLPIERKEPIRVKAMRFMIFRLIASHCPMTVSNRQIKRYRTFIPNIAHYRRSYRILVFH